MIESIPGDRIPFLLNVSTRFRIFVFLLLFSSLMVLSGCGSGGGGNNGSNNNGNGGGTATPSFSSAVTTQGNFSSGQQNASYTITVTNSGTAATSGTVTVVDPPTGFTVTAISGSNWQCTLSTVTCTSSAAVAAGQSYPPITVTGNVTATNGTPVSIPLTVSGGGSTANATSTPSVTVAAPGLTITKSHSGNFTQGQQNAAYTVAVQNSSTGGATNGKVTVTETVPSGETLVSMSGSGWTCPGSGGANTCDRSDMLATNTSYPNISVTVNVSATAVSPQVNQVSVSGGGMTSPASTTDSTTISPAPASPDLKIVKSHVGNFTAGSNGAFSLAVSNVGTGATTGGITVTDMLASQFSYVSAAATGWTCGASGQAVTCTNPGPIGAGTSAATIPLTVAVSSSASGGISNTATVATTGDTNSANNSSTDSVTVVAPASPDLAIVKSHVGNFTAGNNGTFTLAVSNVGTGATTGTITVTDTLAAQFTYVSATAAGWSCGASGQLVTCTNPGPIAAGASATSIPLTVAVSSSASGGISNTATVATTGDTVSSNNSSTDNVTVVAPASPDLSILTSHVGNFPTPGSGAFTLAVSNVGTAATSGTITVNDTLPSALSFVSAAATGWSCGASGQVVTCTNPGPIGAGSVAAVIPLIVSVSGPSGSISNTATVATAGDMDSGNNSSTDSVTAISTSSISSISLAVPGPVIYAGGNTENVTVSVSNDLVSDVLNPTLTLSGAACSAAACGTVGSVTGTAGSGSYTIPYTPPASVNAPTIITLTISSNLPGSFTAVGNFMVYPSGSRVVLFGGLGGQIGQRLTPGSQTRPGLTATVYNDPGGPGSPGPGVSVQLLGSGYACPPASSGTVCGTLAIGSTSFGTTSTGTTGIPFTTTSFSYTPPTSVPNPPFDRPAFIAVSNADATKTNSFPFLISTAGTTGLVIVDNQRLNTALTGAAPMTISANLSGDSGINKTFSWSLTSNGANCQPQCGTLGTPTYIWNGQGVNGSITYTPPAAMPAGAADTPTLTATSVDVLNGFLQSDNFSFSINDGTCGSGNNGVLNGQYAFLLHGGAAGQGYVSMIGSFTADGNGHITAGLFDVNRNVNPSFNVSIAPAGSSYSVGPDNRGCLVLANSLGGVNTYRFALGAISSGTATKGQIIRFDDVSGMGQRLQGDLVKQDPTAFNSSSIKGTYAFGEEGIDAAGGRITAGGLATADGLGTFSNFDRDVNDNGNLDINDTTGSATYAIDSSTGRGTVAFTSGAGTSNFVLYVVSASEFLAMSTDGLSANTPILIGDNRLQTAPNGGFTQTSLDGNSYVYWLSTIDPSNGGNVAVVGQILFNAGGSETGTQYINHSGSPSTAQAVSDAFTISSNGRATNTKGDTAIYVIGTDSAFVVGTGSMASAGFAQKQTGGPFSNTSVSGSYVVSEGAPLDGDNYFSGAATITNSTSSVAATADLETPNGIGSVANSFSYSVTNATTGLFTLTSSDPNDAGSIGFTVSGSELVTISEGTSWTDTGVTMVQK
jgi:uncharacterized repeat protein (TIGR01451 family)